MALSDFQVGHGNYALAYGRHVALGILAGHDDSTPTAIKVKMLLGLGEWEGMTELSYDGSIIDPANYTFHPGTLSTGAADPVQGADARFPNDIYHSRIAYYTVTLPDGMGTEPDKLRAIIDCLKVNDYRIDRNNPTYDFSVNPANAFADVVRRNCVRLGLNFQDYMDWTAYDNAYDFYATQYQIDDEAHTPREVRVSNNSASGSLLTGNYYYRVTSLGANSSESAGSELKLITTSSGSTNTVSWTEDADATVGYRVYFSYNDPDNLDQYFEVASGTTTYAHSTDSGATAGIVPTLPSGDLSLIHI